MPVASEPNSVPGAPGVHGADARCAECGYVLAGLPGAAACPECGSDGVAFAGAWRLSETLPAYRRRLRRGATLAAVGGLGALLGLLVMIRQAFVGGPEGLGEVFLVALLGAQTVCGLGLLLLATDDRERLSDPRTATGMTQVASCLAALAALTGLVGTVLRFDESVGIFSLIVASSTLVTAAAGSVWVMGTLAERAGDERLRDHVWAFRYAMVPLALFAPLACLGPVVAGGVWIWLLVRVRTRIASPRAVPACEEHVLG